MTTSVPTVPRNRQQKSYAQLQDENRELRAQLERFKEEQGEVRFSSENQRLLVDGLETPDFTVERLTAHTPAMKQAMALFSADSLAKNEGKPDFSVLKDLGEEPVRVEELRVKVPQSTIDRVVKENAKHPDLKELQVKLGDQGRFEVEGVANKFWLDVPFHVDGTMEATADGQVRVRLKSGKVFGMVPVPKILMGLATAAAEKKVDKIKITKEGDDLLIDPRSVKPKNIEFNLGRVTTEHGSLVIEGGTPVAAPKTLTVGPWGPIPQN